MSRGYSLHLVLLNNGADPSNLGVRLGRACIARDISVIQVAEELGVTRQTVYNWFAGASSPHWRCADRVEQYLNNLT
jgi:transcriptional regulator with XRE-family HTH domain